MNISTYEARIKALEDQLYPPGEATGLLSLIVSPDITLSDSSSLNSKLAELMPVENGVNVLDFVANALTVGDKYSFTYTPSSGYYAYDFSGGDPVPAGTPVTATAEVEFSPDGPHIEMVAVVGPTIDFDESTAIGISLDAAANA